MKQARGSPVLAGPARSQPSLRVLQMRVERYSMPWRAPRSV